MPKMNYALVKEQGVEFAVVVVKSQVFQTESKQRETIQSMRPHFPNVPLILMCQDTRGRPKYYGRKDIIDFLSKIDYRRLPWREKSV